MIPYEMKSISLVFRLFNALRYRHLSPMISDAVNKVYSSNWLILPEFGPRTKCAVHQWGLRRAGKPVVERSLDATDRASNDEKS